VYFDGRENGPRYYSIIDVLQVDYRRIAEGYDLALVADRLPVTSVTAITFTGTRRGPVGLMITRTEEIVNNSLPGEVTEVTGNQRIYPRPSRSAPVSFP
jgi:hypothetical protein